MVHEMLRTEDKVIPWIASSKSSDQKKIWDTEVMKSESRKHCNFEANSRPKTENLQDFLHSTFPVSINPENFKLH
jgi:hypothetical protein